MTMVSPDEPAAAGGAHAGRGGDTPRAGSAGRTPPSGPGGLRIGDRERDEVTRLLHDAFAQGRITREELDERLDATLSARTAEDLRRVTADLPGAWPGDARAGGAPGGGPRTGSPWHPGFPSAGLPGFPGHPGSPMGARPGPYGPLRPGGPQWAAADWGRANWGRANWGRANWGRGGSGRGMAPRWHGRRPHPAMFLIPVAAIVLLMAGPMWPPFLVLKLVIVALVVRAVLGMTHHRRRHGPHTRR
ncbi:DUF1707 domain-containing protein [Microbispora hainanensis]|uniref:DUF1707 SHOCT-like domain-containing protein n=1 Tax=Microbispora hainanensis TaxID=568844 RepID=UPI0033F80678